jgi:hypothetical protein
MKSECSEFNALVCPGLEREYFFSERIREEQPLREHCI